MADKVKKESYGVGVSLADISSTDYTSEYSGRNIAGFIINSANAPATLKVTDTLGNTTQLDWDAGYHPINLTKIWYDAGNSITSVKVFY